ncbi:MAG: hydrolase TatD, partial [Verrucomicrobia bacterium]
RGWPEPAIDQVLFGNPLRFLGQNPRFRLPETEAPSEPR